MHHCLLFFPGVYEGIVKKLCKVALWKFLQISKKQKEKTFYDVKPLRREIHSQNEFESFYSLSKNTKTEPIKRCNAVKLSWSIETALDIVQIFAREKHYKNRIKSLGVSSPLPVPCTQSSFAHWGNPIYRLQKQKLFVARLLRFSQQLTIEFLLFFSARLKRTALYVQLDGF